MAFRKPIGKAPDEGVRVKNSYYTFSKEYPAGGLSGNKRPIDKKNSRKKRLAFFGAALSFLCLTAAFFFVFDLGLKISYKAPSESALQSVIPEDTQGVRDGFCALFMPQEKLSDKKYIKQLIREIRKKDADSVIIDFKTEDGYLAYCSKNEMAALSKCSLWDNATAAEAVSLFQSSGVRVIARVFCFKGPIIAEKYSSLAVKYQNSNVNWTDKSAEEGGKPRLNPYSENARNYVLDILKEISAFGVGSFVLDSVDFPSGRAADTAGFPGETNKSKRNELILGFLKDAKKALPKDSKIYLALSVSDMLDKSSPLSNNSGINGVLAYTENRPGEYTASKDNGFASILSMFSSLRQNAPDGSRLILWIDSGEYSKKYISAIKKAGYESFVVCDKDGIY